MLFSHRQYHNICPSEEEGATFFRQDGRQGELTRRWSVRLSENVKLYCTNATKYRYKFCHIAELIFSPFGVIIITSKKYYFLQYKGENTHEDH